jgi:hypothetical protein
MSLEHFGTKREERERLSSKTHGDDSCHSIQSSYTLINRLLKAEKCEVYSIRGDYEVRFNAEEVEAELVDLSY